MIFAMNTRINIQKPNYIFLYIRNVAGLDRVAFNDPDCNRLTAADGSIPKTRWINHVHR